MLADFGLVRVVLSGAAMTSGARGTVNYMAPENWDHEQPDFAKQPADMYSLGMVLYELSTGTMPWEGLIDPKIMFSVMVERRRPPFPASWPAEWSDLRALIEACWAQDPLVRPDAAAVEQRLLAMA